LKITDLFYMHYRSLESAFQIIYSCSFCQPRPNQFLSDLFLYAHITWSLSSSTLRSSNAAQRRKKSSYAVFEQTPNFSHRTESNRSMAPRLIHIFISPSYSSDNT